MGVSVHPCLDVGGKESSDVVAKVGKEEWELVGVLGKEGAKDQKGVGQGEKDMAMAGDLATGVQFATGLGAMGGDGMCELFFEDCVVSLTSLVV